MCVTMPSRMVNDKSLTIKAELLDKRGDIEWRQWDVFGSVSAVRVSDQSAVPTSIVVFDTHDGVPPADSIRFYNGMGCVTILLDNGAAEPAGDIEVTVSLSGEAGGTPFSVSASKMVTVLDNPTSRGMSGTLSGDDLTWGSGDGVIHVTGNITVGSNDTLTINPGTLIMIDRGVAGPPSYGTLINVYGQVQAIGAQSEPIFIFPTNAAPALQLMETCADPPYNPDAWRGIFHYGDGTSTYEHVILTGAGNGSVAGHARPPIMRFQDGHSLDMNKCVLAYNCGKPLHGTGNGSYTVKKTLIAKNGHGADWEGNGDYTLLIEDTWFVGLGRAEKNPCGYDGDCLNIIALNPDYVGDKVVRGCVFADGGDDALDSLRTHPHVENCIFWNLRDKALSMSGGNSPATFFNLLMFDVSFAADAHGGDEGTVFSLSNSTMKVLRYEALTALVSGTTVDQCIIWPTTVYTCYIADYNHCVLGLASNTSCGVGNIAADPLFVDSANRNYLLQPGSPANTAGPNGEQVGWLGFPTPMRFCFGDLDDDGDVDLADFSVFADCMAGPNVTTPPPGCSMEQFRLSDVDYDLDVDLYDAARFQIEISPGL